MLKVLFVCNKNSGRSQMAEAFLRNMAQDRANVTSAGSNPAADIDPVVVTAMRELNVEMDGQTPKKFTPELGADVDHLISMGCELVPVGVTDTWDFDDPSGQTLDQVRRIRDQVRARVEILAADLNVARTPGTTKLS